MNGILEKKAKSEKIRPTDERTVHNAEGDMKKHDQQDGLKKSDSPMSNILVEDEKTPTTASQTRAERRKQKRAGVKLFVRLRPADSNDPKFEEILGTLNASRANLYVITTSRNYYKLMRLRVTFPYDAKFDKASMQEDIAEVVRLDHLPGWKNRSSHSIAATGPLSIPHDHQRIAFRGQAK